MCGAPKSSFCLAFFCLCLALDWLGGLSLDLLVMWPWAGHPSSLDLFLPLYAIFQVRVRRPGGPREGGGQRAVTVHRSVKGGSPSPPPDPLQIQVQK